MIKEKKKVERRERLNPGRGVRVVNRNFYASENYVCSYLATVLERALMKRQTLSPPSAFSGVLAIASLERVVSDLTIYLYMLHIAV